MAFVSAGIQSDYRSKTRSAVSTAITQQELEEESRSGGTS